MIIFAVLLALLGLALLLASFIAALLPDHWAIEEAVLVNTTPDKLFPLLDDLKAWETWSVWSAQDRKMAIEIEYPGISKGKGAIQLWSSRTLNAKLALTSSLANETVSFSLEVKEANLKLKGIIALGIADVGYTQVAWRFVLDPLESKNPIRRYQAFFFKNYISKALERNLANLQNRFSLKQEINEN
jgi:hypothetical protein